MGLVHSLIVMIRAHEESDTKSKRVKAAIRRQCEAWMAGTSLRHITFGQDPKWVSYSKENGFKLVLVEQCALFARRQTEALAGITQMARGLTCNEGLAKDRARLAATLEIFSAECAAEVKAHMDSLVAISASQWPTGIGEDSVRSLGLFPIPVIVH